MRNSRWERDVVRFCILAVQIQSTNIVCICSVLGRMMMKKKRKKGKETKVACVKGVE